MTIQYSNYDVTLNPHTVWIPDPRLGSVMDRVPIMELEFCQRVQSGRYSVEHHHFRAAYNRARQAYQEALEASSVERLGEEGAAEVDRFAEWLHEIWGTPYQSRYYFNTIRQFADNLHMERKGVT